MRNYFKKKRTTIATIILVAVIIGGAFIEEYSYAYQWEWVLIPWVRMIFHAVAAVAISMVLSWVGMIWAVISRELMGAWISVICFPFVQKRNAIVRFCRKGFTVVFKWLQPFIGTMLYIKYSYDWEFYQAEYYERAVQMDQLRIDIIFAIIGGILWIVIYRSMMIDKNYLVSAGESIRFVRELIWTCEDACEEEGVPKKVSVRLQKAIIVLVVLIPVIVILFGVLFSWITLKTMSDGLWWLG